MSDLVKRLCRPGYDLQKEQAIQEAIIEIRELRAKIEAMERQEPYCWTTTPPTGQFCRYKSEVERWVSNGWNVVPLYPAPGAQPAPSVPEGWKLVPIEPTENMISEGACASSLPGPRYISEDCAKQCWEYMLAAAPEAKP